ncbi:hypothetical protein HPB50_013202 [Hyalomma asiaticum]|uniref:Uncharacterized protein n=1 Tax=Hyalomma asiaticum TaxID=266040 RepID=A0ACB7TH19_HYAAI|nr:hypothetical protein HPB50_013202 [Hyalomma asiaticum]
MAAIRKVPLIITGGEDGKTSPLVVFSKDSSSTTSIGVYSIATREGEGKQAELASWDAAQRVYYDRLKPRTVALGRDLDVLQHRLSGLPGEEPGVREAGITPLLPQPVHHPGREQGLPQLPGLFATPGHDEEGTRGGRGRTRTVAEHADTSNSPGMPCEDPGQS